MQPRIRQAGSALSWMHGLEVVMQSHRDPEGMGTRALLSGEEMALMKARITMSDQRASVVVNAPLEQVYAMFTHFNDFPKFMHFVKEVTYYDDVRSHWVVDIAGRHEWDAENANWIPNQQVGWVSTSGLQNSGIVTFTPNGANQTLLDVSIAYNPPGGVLGDAGEALGAGKRFQQCLLEDLSHFARMVERAPAGALDPMSSTYIFHEDSAAARGESTDAQNQTMDDL
jgi:uncharacterized membrane protein